MSNTYLLTSAYWVNAKAAREAQRPLEAQAMLWGLATSPAASERVRQAAYTHLVKTSDHMGHNEFFNSKPSAY